MNTERQTTYVLVASVDDSSPLSELLDIVAKTGIDPRET